MSELYLSLGHFKLGCCVLPSFSLVAADDPMLRVVFIGVVDLARNGHKVDWDAMSPPKLPRDAPILNILQEAVPCGMVLLRSDDQVAVSDSLDSPRGHILTIDVPLWLQKRLNDIV